MLEINYIYVKSIYFLVMEDLEVNNDILHFETFIEKLSLCPKTQGK